MNYLNRFIPFLGVVIIVFGLSTACSSQAGPSNKTVYEDSIPVEDTLKTLTLTCVGDLMCHSPQFKFVQIAKDSFNFMPCLSRVLPYLGNADFTFGNLETTLSGVDKGFSGYPQFNAPDDYAVAMHMAGFDFLTHANNHSLDRREYGVVRTARILDSIGLGHTGSYVTEADRDSIRIVDVKGIKMAMLAYTYGTNGIPTPEGKPWMVNYIDSTLMVDDIKKAREMGADLVIMNMHWGNEGQRKPNTYQKTAAKWVMEAGADLVIGAHPHTVQPMEFFKAAESATLDSGFVCWSLGNFFSNQVQRYQDAGVILTLELTQNTNSGEIWISKVEFLPTWVYRGKNELKRQHIIYPAEYVFRDSLDAWLTEENIDQMKEAFDDTRTNVVLYEKDIEMIRLGE